ncbi:MAG: hypothetical protein GF313_15820 [Caldithrix sp.]|nr:hypothetical protein [Caldithrix sp.]
MNAALQKLDTMIRTHDQFVLTSHVHSDGDAVGSLLAFKHLLQKHNKEAEVFLPSAPPAKYGFLQTDQHINRLSYDQKQQKIAEADVILILDISALERLDHLYDSVHKSTAVKVCIDHHPVKKDWVDLQIVDTSKVATAEILYDFFKAFAWPICRQMADALYTGILSDSGGFRFDRTTGSTFRMAAELTDLGADPINIYSRLFENSHPRQLKAWGQFLNEMHIDHNISYLTIRQDDLVENNVTIEEIDGLIDLMRKDGYSKVFIIFVEKDKQEVIVGLRSKNGVNVGKIAEEFGGGGHFHASGFSSKTPMDTVVTRTIQRIKQDNNLTKG